MFDVYLSDKRDRLLVIPKGVTIPVDETRWHKKRSVVSVSERIKLAIQRDGYYRRRLGKDEHAG
jgi:hypothetical protein